MGEGAEQKRAGERGASRKKAIVKVSNQPRGPPHLQEASEQESTGISSVLQQNLQPPRLKAPRPGCSACKHQNGLGVPARVAQRRQQCQRRCLASLRISAPARGTSPRLKAAGRGSEHGKPPPHQSWESQGDVLRNVKELDTHLVNVNRLLTAHLAEGIN